MSFCELLVLGMVEQAASMAEAQASEVRQWNEGEDPRRGSVWDVLCANEKLSDHSRGTALHFACNSRYWTASPERHLKAVDWVLRAVADKPAAVSAADVSEYINRDHTGGGDTCLSWLVKGMPRALAPMRAAHELVLAMLLAVGVDATGDKATAHAEWLDVYRTTRSGVASQLLRRAASVGGPLAVRDTLPSLVGNPYFDLVKGSPAIVGLLGGGPVLLGLWAECRAQQRKQTRRLSGGALLSLWGAAPRQLLALVLQQSGVRVDVRYAPAQVAKGDLWGFSPQSPSGDG